MDRRSFLKGVGAAALTAALPAPALAQMPRGDVFTVELLEMAKRLALTAAPSIRPFQENYVVYLPPSLFNAARVAGISVDGYEPFKLIRRA